MSTSTMASNEPPCWEAPTFSFNADNQAKEWKKFHTRVIDFLEALNIDPDTPDKSKCGWHQIKMMFQDGDREALQALLDNNTITPEDQLTPTRVLNAIQTSIKEDEHFWHYRDELLSDFRQEHQEGIHSLNNRITQLIKQL